MLRCLCSASSIFPVVYLIKATTTTRKMEDPEQKLFRMTSYLMNSKKAHSNKAGIPDYNLREWRHGWNNKAFIKQSVIPEECCRESSADMENKESSFPYLTWQDEDPRLRPSGMTYLMNGKNNKARPFIKSGSCWGVSAQHLPFSPLFI